MPKRRDFRVFLYSIALVVVVGSILWLQSFGSDGLPFDAADVSIIKFHFDYRDSTEVVVRDQMQVESLMSALRVKPGFQTLCVHEQQIIFTINGKNLKASVCRDCFHLHGDLTAYLRMPDEFYRKMQAYRDSTRLREPCL